MGHMTALYWFELNDLRYRVAAVVILPIAVHALGAVPSLRPLIYSNIDELLWVIGVTSVILLGTAFSKSVAHGLDPVRSTRSASAKQILLARILSCTVTLFISLSLFLGPLFLFPSVQNILPAYKVKILQLLAYPMALTLLFLYFWFIYALILLGTCLVRNSLAAIASGLLSIALVIALVLLIGDPPLFLERYIGLLGGIFSDKGRYVRIAEDWQLVLLRVAFWGTITVGLFSLAAGCVTRSLTIRLRWYLFILGSTMAIIIAVRATLKEQEVIFPTGRIELTSYSSDLSIEDHYALVASREGLTIIDIASASSPAVVVELSLPDWATTRVGTSTRFAFLSGRLTTGQVDSVGLAFLDIQNRKKPAWLGHLALGTPETVLWIGKPHVDGSYCFVGMADRDQVSLLAFEVVESTSLTFLHSVPIEVCSSGLTEQQKIHYDRKFQMQLSAGYAYIASRSGLTIVSVQDPHQLEVVSRLFLGDADIPHIWSRSISVLGNTAYIPRFFPRELVSVDINDPLNPVETGRFYLYNLPKTITVHDSILYSKGYSIGVLSLTRSGFLEPLGLLGLRQSVRGTNEAGSILRGDHVVSVMGKNLVIYPVSKR